jgi:hypothetical protein
MLCIFEMMHALGNWRTRYVQPAIMYVIFGTQQLLRTGKVAFISFRVKKVES